MRKAQWMTGVLGAALIAFAGVGSAQAQQACEATEFGSEAGQVYLNAETELIQNDNPAGALQQLNQLRSMELNCYERGAMLRLSAAVKINQDDLTGAIRDLEEAIRVGAIAGDQVGQTYYSIAQLHLQTENVPQAKAYMDRWLATGVTPTRDQNWQLAVIHQQLEDYRGALPYAERVLAADGNNASRQTIDFLIFLYDRTGDRAKKAELLQRLLRTDPNDRRVWDAIAGDYYSGNQERRAFEVYKAMYLAGLLTEEQEIMRVVNFYNQFNVPFEAARILEMEMNRGRVSKTFERLELLATLYQVAREFDRALPAIREAAQMSPDGKMYERLGRSLFELGEYEDAIEAYQSAISRGGLSEPGYARVMIGQAMYELDRKGEARDFFNEATRFSDGRRAANGWINFLDSEVRTQLALQRFQLQTRLQGLTNEKDSCQELIVFGSNLPEGCSTIDDRIAEVQAEIDQLG